MDINGLGWVKYTSTEKNFLVINSRNFQGAFKTLSNIYDGVFMQISLTNLFPMHPFSTFVFFWKQMG